MIRILTDLFVNSFKKNGPKTAIIFLKRGEIILRASFSDLDKESNSMANVFLEMDVKKGDRVILYIPKCLEHVVAHLAIQKIGAIIVPLNPGFKKKEMEYFLTDSGAKMAIVGKSEETLMRELKYKLELITVDTNLPYYNWKKVFSRASTIMPIAEIGPNDPAMIIYTSGTTGQPKGAVLTHGNLAHDALNIIKIWEITDTDVLCHTLPLFHIHGLCFAMHTSLIAGAKMVMLEEFRADRVINVLSQTEGELACNVFMAVPTMYTNMINSLKGKTIDFSHIRLLTSGSAPLLPGDFYKIKEVFGQEPVEREGMTETGMNFSNPVRGKRKPGSIGLPLPDLDVRIVDPDTFADVDPGQEGEIWLRGPAVTPGYWRKPEETAKAFEEGWFRTGDLGRVDEDGYYYLTDRIKHIIISGGENVSPKEVEVVINQIEDVVESSVVGIPDEKWGEKVVAAVVKKSGSGIEPGEIINYCKEHLHNWKCPKDIIFLKELPKNNMGKVLKEEVKKSFKH
ncbi:MAG: AMP-binding protein [Desulfobacterales bacterium]|nr:AMP-binding protein [Desulfobacterales bacterium]